MFEVGGAGLTGGDLGVEGGNLGFKGGDFAFESFDVLHGGAGILVGFKGVLFGFFATVGDTEAVGVSGEGDKAGGESEDGEGEGGEFVFECEMGVHGVIVAWKVVVVKGVGVLEGDFLGKIQRNLGKFRKMLDFL